MTQQEWRDRVDDMNIEFRKGIYMCLFRPFTPLIENVISGLFGKIFKELMWFGKLKTDFNKETHDLTIEWQVPSDPMFPSGTTNSEKYWHFKMILRHECREVFEDEITKAFN